jgi:hypothetical protein
MDVFWKVKEVRQPWVKPLRFAEGSQNIPLLVSFLLPRRGLTPEWGTPAAPKDFLASLSLTPLRRSVLVPL